MLIDNNNQSLVVGFLCTYKGAENFPDKTWVEITATIDKGNYHGDIPILTVKDICKIEKPSDEFVYPPDDFYIPTAALYYSRD